MLPFAFEEGMGFERYVDYALDVPMYFVKRGEIYHDVAARASATSWTDGCASYPASARQSRIGQPSVYDLSGSAPEDYLEMRGADAGPRAHITALPALFAGFSMTARRLTEPMN